MFALWKVRGCMFALWKVSRVHDLFCMSHGNVLYCASQTMRQSD